MEHTFQELDIHKLRELLPPTVSENLADDFFIGEIHLPKREELLRYPFRFNGYMAIFCVSGRLQASINLSSYEVRKNFLILALPGNIMNIEKLPEEDDDVHFFVAAISRRFITEMRLELSGIANEAVSLLQNPCVELSGQQRSICMKYFSLVLEIAQMNSPEMKGAMRSLISSIIFLLRALWADRAVVRSEEGSPRSVRSKLVFEEFIRLVTEHHMQERRMGFYADRLHLTPKYLSKLIANVSGTPATDWIDSFVILEAKNMLKYSELETKEIADRLHFSNVSSFHKFFKKHTNMTPNEYRKS